MIQKIINSIDHEHFKVLANKAFVDKLEVIKNKPHINDKEKISYEELKLFNEGLDIFNKLQISRKLDKELLQKSAELFYKSLELNNENFKAIIYLGFIFFILNDQASSILCLNKLKSLNYSDEAKVKQLENLLLKSNDEKEDLKVEVALKFEEKEVTIEQENFNLDDADNIKIDFEEELEKTDFSEEEISFDVEVLNTDLEDEFETLDFSDEEAEIPLPMDNIVPSILKPKKKNNSGNSDQLFEQKVKLNPLTQNTKAGKYYSSYKIKSF